MLYKHRPYLWTLLCLNLVELGIEMKGISALSRFFRLSKGIHLLSFLHQIFLKSMIVFYKQWVYSKIVNLECRIIITPTPAANCFSNSNKILVQVYLTIFLSVQSLHRITPMYTICGRTYMASARVPLQSLCRVQKNNLQ